MTEPYRPLNTDAALRCETCGAHPDDFPVQVHLSLHHCRALWTCPACDRLVVADVAADQLLEIADRRAIDHLRAILSDDTRFEAELEAIRRSGGGNHPTPGDGGRPEPSPGGVNADRLPVIDLTEGR